MVRFLGVTFCMSLVIGIKKVKKSFRSPQATRATADSASIYGGERDKIKKQP